MQHQSIKAKCTGVFSEFSKSSRGIILKEGFIFFYKYKSLLEDGSYDGVAVEPFQFSVHITQGISNHTDNGNNQRAKSNGPQMVSVFHGKK